jgi:biopolymer transport protein ExbD
MIGGRNPAAARLQLIGPRRRRELDDSLVPLINVVFLMLIFFMLAGRIVTPDALQIEPPTSAQGRPVPPAPVVLLMDADGTLALDGEVLALPELETRLADRLAKTSDLGAAASPSAELAVTLKADAAVRHAQLRPLLERLRAAGIERLRLASKPSYD